MRRIVLDAYAFMTWFGRDGRGRGLRAEYEAGGLAVLVPASFRADVLELASSRQRLPPAALERLAGEIDRIGFVTEDPPSAELARWLGRGCDGRRASYAALASAEDLPLLSDDADTLRVASSVARGADTW